MNTNKYTRSIFLSCLAILFLSGCAAKTNIMPPTPVETTTIKTTTINESSDYMANLISRKSVSLQSQVAGQVKNIYVKPGDFVKKGQLLILIDPIKQNAAVDEATANAEAQRALIGQAQNNLDTVLKEQKALKSNLNFTQKRYKRYKILYSQQSASKQDFEQFKNEYTSAESDLNVNKAKVAVQQSTIDAAQKQYLQAQAAINQEKAQLQFYKITAPFSGIIGDIPVKTGNYIEPTTLLISVTNNNALEVNISIPTEYLSKTKLGLPVRLLDENDNVIGNTNISFISQRIDTTSQTVLVKAILKNPKWSFKADQMLNAEVIWSKHPGITIPTESVVHMGGRDFVFVAKPQKNSKMLVAKQYSVDLAQIKDTSYVVKNGLHSGDILITSGIQKLIDGAPVMTMPKK